MSDIEPVRVHLAGSDVALTAAARPERLRAINLFTVVLTSDEPVKQLLRPDPNRVVAHVQAGGANVVLCKTKADAQAASNTADTTLARPNGMVLPFGNTGPWPLDTTAEVWAAAASYPAQIAVSVVTKAAS